MKPGKKTTTGNIYRRDTNGGIGQIGNFLKSILDAIKTILNQAIGIKPKFPKELTQLNF